MHTKQRKHNQLTKVTRPKTKQKTKITNKDNYAIMAPTDYESHNSLQLPFI